MFSGFQHEKYTSQLQLGQETPETKKHIQTDEKRRDSPRAKSEKTERKNITGTTEIHEIKIDSLNSKLTFSIHVSYCD